MHHFHGLINTRTYGTRRILPRSATPGPGEDVAYDERGMPVWPDTHGGRILNRAMPEYHRLVKEYADRGKRLSRKETRDLYDRHAIEEYGPIDKEHPFYVATVLRSGGMYTTVHVRWLKAQFERKCKVPFKFICISDIDIPGVHVIPMMTSIREASDTLCQMEYFRPFLFPPEASVLCTDLDTVVYGEFVPHRCPKDQLFIGREVNNWNQSRWATWNCGLMFWRGDFTHLFRRFQRDVSRGGQYLPGWQAIGTQEYITSTLKAFDIYPMDVESHICTRFYCGRPDDVPGCTHILQFPGSPKPWDLDPLPTWCPELPSRGSGRKSYEKVCANLKIGYSKF